MNRIIFIRTDANVKIGYGHLSRCLILADELKDDNSQVYFLVFDTEEVILKKIIEKGFQLILLTGKSPDEMLKIILQAPSALKILIFDTDEKIYYTPEVQLKFIHHSIRLIFFAFWNQYQYLADIIINQNPLSIKQDYHTAPNTKKLLGPEYMIFDDRTIELGRLKQERIKSPSKTVLISFGGSDEPDRTLKTLKAFQALDLDINHFNIVAGALYPHEGRLLKFLDSFRYAFQLYMQTEKMPEIMYDSDIAFCAGGLTLWELALFRIPAAIISFSDREILTANHLDKNHLGYHLGSINNLPLEELSQKIANFVDDKEAVERMVRLKKIINAGGKKSIVKEIQNLHPDD